MLSIQIKLSAQTTECDRGVWAPDVDSILMFTRDQCLELWVVDDASYEHSTVHQDIACLWESLITPIKNWDWLVHGVRWEVAMGAIAYLQEIIDFPARYVNACCINPYINCLLFYHVSTPINSRLSQTNGFHCYSCVFLSRLTKQRELWTICLVWKHQISCFFQTRYRRQKDDFAFFSLLILSDIVKFSWKCP